MKRLLFGLATLLASAAPAFAHLNPAEHGSFAAGFSHPLTGTDHILAMVAVGLWAASLGGRATWLVPTAFVTIMAAGFGAAMLYLPPPFVEPIIMASVIIIGLLAAVALQVPTIAGMAMVAFFAFFHGHAHGGELGLASALPFAAGFALATAALHLSGVAVGLGLGKLFGAPVGRLVTQFAGGLTALGGLWLAIGA